MIDLYHKATNQLLGSLTEAELQVLIEGLEEESQRIGITTSMLRPLIS